MNLDKLKEIGKEIIKQDNRGTHQPLFCVYESRRIYGVMSSDCDFIKTELLEDGSKITYVSYNYMVSSHLTNRAAEQFIERNAHNLEDPSIFIRSMKNWPEMIAIREALIELGQQTVDVEVKTVPNFYGF